MNDQYIPADDIEAPYSATFRTGAGYEAALLTVRGNDAQQILDRIEELNKAGGFQTVVDTNNLLQGVATASAPAPANAAPAGGQRSGGQRQQSQPAANTGGAETHPEGLTCSSCNQPVIYKKINKGSRSFELWVCPNQKSRNDGHHSEFIN